MMAIVFAPYVAINPIIRAGDLITPRVIHLMTFVNADLNTVMIVDLMAHWKMTGLIIG